MERQPRESISFPGLMERNIHAPSESITLPQASGIGHGKRVTAEKKTVPVVTPAVGSSGAEAVAPAKRGPGRPRKMI